ncbi:hypothetical protein COLO4_27834 [Corchorus olitorius]|uniref:Protein kinase domain-containing protein n=1 Tax=Corchorus olitorius TaxID=93759 RepID=A0A1R3HP07_9ROSI|nr:hypothetical protein COLO4_27834 [Corchorus olitorius]
MAGIGQVMFRIQTTISMCLELLDYTVLIRDQFLGKQVKQDLWLELHPNLQTKPQYYDAILNGVEIFKLSNEDGNLAGLNPSLINESSTDGNEPFPGPRSSKSSKKEVLVIAGTSIFGLLVIVLLVVFLLKRRMEGTKKNTRNSLCYRSFSINELKMATDDFDEAKLIDTSAFGKVYKGYIDNGNTAVTINRVTEAMSKQELDKFEVEIRNHYHIRHRNIVKLIGYCKEENEMILVYEYMPNGTLFDHLHFADQRQQQQSTLSWNQRLEICIGAARGLHYLHSATTHPIIHGDIMTKNILLDKNWTAKISCFLPSKLAVTSHNCKNLTEKSDVYSFGVVLLELLSGRPAMNQSLVQRALTCLEESKVDILVDPYLKGKIAPASLTKFIEITQKCLLDQGVNQPSMIEVLCSLELAQQLQDQRPQNTNGSARDWDFYSGSNFMLGLEFYGEGRFLYRRKPYPCIFWKQTTYTVTVSPGPKFIRLHFEPIRYPVLEFLDLSKALFSVSVAGYTLINISKFSEHNLLADYAVREFCININDQTVNVTFSPSLKISDSFAFVNKIEVVSMPSNLYIKEHFPIPLVGSPNYHDEYYIENSRALEMMHRVNVGGDLVPPEEDSGMSRLWVKETGYLMSDKRSARIMKSRMAINFSSSIMPAYTAPEKVYASARIVDIKGNLAKWSFPIDSGFYYFVRLHFCDISGWIEEEEGVFHVSINNHTVEDHANVFHWSHGAGVPTYKDYIVNFSRHSADGIKYLSVAIGLHNQSQGDEGCN